MANTDKVIAYSAGFSAFGAVVAAVFSVLSYFSASEATSRVVAVQQENNDMQRAWREFQITDNRYRIALEGETVLLASNNGGARSPDRVNVTPVFRTASGERVLGFPVPYSGGALEESDTDNGRIFMIDVPVAEICMFGSNAKRCNSGEVIEQFVVEYFIQDVSTSDFLPVDAETGL